MNRARIAAVRAEDGDQRPTRGQGGRRVWLRERTSEAISRLSWAGSPRESGDVAQPEGGIDACADPERRQIALWGREQSRPELEQGIKRRIVASHGPFACEIGGGGSVCLRQAFEHGARL